MPELRIDPLSGLRAIVAGARADRPGGGFAVEPPPPLDPEGDPFLEGHEARTPPELWALRPGGGKADGPGWLARAVPNLYPALRPAMQEPAPGAPSRAGTDPLAGGRGEPELFAARPAEGAHEVIVNGPGPARSLAELDPDQLEVAMGAWRERMRAHVGAAYVHVIINEGREAGASLAHSHAQLYALPFVPAAIARERERFTAYADRTAGRDLLSDLLQEEVRRDERIVAIDREAVALCPFASRVPYQVQIVPRAARPRYEDDGPLGARLLREVLGRLAAALGAVPALNLWVRTAPRDAEYFCWRIDLVPKLTHLAGLELGTGVHLNTVAPERAAAALREVAPVLPPAASVAQGPPTA
ncbi:galactose-1-phosphate uridylyltransferase [soil metagenome]|jgi:UDPglucose--hexose-1-phosphate uridylyltransferase